MHENRTMKPTEIVLNRDGKSSRRVDLISDYGHVWKNHNETSLYN
jgi:hypothetical protein